MVAQEYFCEDWSVEEAHSQTLNFFIVDAGKVEKRVEYCVLEELGEELMSEALDGLVCME